MVAGDQRTGVDPRRRRDSSLDVLLQLWQVYWNAVLRALMRASKGPSARDSSAPVAPETPEPPAPEAEGADEHPAATPEDEQPAEAADDEWGQACLSDGEDAKQALDELFRLTRRYRSSAKYFELLQFVGRFRFYSPYNSFLVHTQMPGARFVAPPRRWLRDYQHRIKANARPLVILQPMGPVMFVFDVSDTEPVKDNPPLPREVTSPFEVRTGKIGEELRNAIESAKRDGVRISFRDAGSQSAGEIQACGSGSQEVVVRYRPSRQTVSVPVCYELLLSSERSPEEKFSTFAHELGHLYCGHLGTINPKWWPDRRGLDHGIREFEAESVCYLVCKRFGIDTPSDAYLSGYVTKEEEVPRISLEAVMAASGLIESMARVRLKARKQERHSE